MVFILHPSKPTKGVPKGTALGGLLFFIFATSAGDLLESLGDSYHQYADDTPLSTTIGWWAEKGFSKLSTCADAVTGWHLENNLLINRTKSEAIVTGTRQQIAKSDQSSRCHSHLYRSSIRCTFTVSSSAASLLSGIRSTKWCSPATFTWAHFGLFGRCCRQHNCMCHHMDAAWLWWLHIIWICITLWRLQRIQNSLMHFVCVAPYRTPATNLRRWHWLQIQERIVFKIATITHKHGSLANRVTCGTTSTTTFQRYMFAHLICCLGPTYQDRECLASTAPKIG